MSIDRVIIQGAVLRVSAAGVDANSAQFNNLIFDGDQAPLRLWVNGWVSVGFLAFPDGSTLVSTQGPGGLVTPSGTTPIFFLSTHQPVISGVVNPGAVTNDNRTPYITDNNYGMGGTIEVGTFFGFNFNRDQYNGNTAPQNFASDGIVNYAIMKNYQ